MIDEQPFSWIETPNYFSTSPRKRQRSEDRDSENLHEASLLTSEATCILNTEESTTYKAAKQTESDATLMESTEGQLEYSAQE